MRIEVLEQADMRQAVETWARSRERAGTYELAEVIAVDAPVNEMPSYLLAFEDFTIFEREIFTTLRSHHLWARTSRVDDPLQFRVPKEFYDVNPEYYTHLRLKMMVEKDSGVIQDDWRMHLPLASMTSWTARINYRDMVKLFLYFDYLQHRVHGPQRKRLAVVTNQLYELLHASFGGPVLKIVKAMKMVKFLHEGPIKYEFDTIATPSFKAIQAIVPVALRAQIVRHRQLMFVDNFYEMLASEECVMYTLRDVVYMELCASYADWTNILASRSCWIAQTELWRDVTWHFDVGVLPCSDGKCPYVADAEARIAGKDPNPPCPRYMNLYHKPKANWLAAMSQLAQQRGQFWIDEVNK